MEEKKKESFKADVINGLSSPVKKLDSKYFYDEIGDKLFQYIMACDEYYVTRCESEIFQQFSNEIASALKQNMHAFDLIELGAGDASKTVFLLEKLIVQKTSFTYIPIDISEDIISYLESTLPKRYPEIEVKGLAGEYIGMLKNTNSDPSRKRVVLFLGSTIGNMERDAALSFLKEVRSHLNSGDRLLIGFDLKKDPHVVLAAYDDRNGYTRDFNLNLLSRINKELDGDFDLRFFEHYPTYDPVSGACKSFLVSKKDQVVAISGESFNFRNGEIIDMELSQKYDPSEIPGLAKEVGFKVNKVFTDSKSWFTDVIWECI